MNPVNLGININVLKQLVQYPVLENHIKDLVEHSKSIMLAMHHSTYQIKKILKRVLKNSKFARWWESLFIIPTEFAEAWHILVHPFIIILILQVVTIILIVATVGWVKVKVKRVMNRSRYSGKPEA